MPATIDTFDTGSLDITERTGSYPSYQSGTMIGNGRFVNLIIAANPQNQPAHVDIANGFLNLSVGAEQYVRLEVGYGWQPDGTGGGQFVPLTSSGVGDFTAIGSAFRITFRSSDNMPINFNILVFTQPGWAIAGQNLYVAPFAGPTHYDFPFDDFSGPAGVDFSSVTAFVCVFQTYADLVIESLEII